MTTNATQRRDTRARERWTRQLSVAATLLVATVGVGCSAILSGPTPERTERPTVVVPDEVVDYDANGTATENQTLFLQTLEVASAHEGQYTSQALAQYFIDAGFDPAVMQVSQERTRTDLEPESMFISARFGEECLVGQVVTSDRSFVGEVVAAVGPDSSLCLIGETVPVDE